MDYLASIERAIEYIERHLDEVLRPEDIAAAAGYSLYHLTHIFTAVIGEPIGSYVQKRRLSESCKKLLHTEKRVIDIAVESGFGSSEAYSRAFKSAYGISPAAYRKNNLELYTGAKKIPDRAALIHLAEGITLKPRIAELGKIHVAGICGQTSTDNNVLPDLWLRLTEYSRLIPGSSAARRIGICESDRTSVQVSGDGTISFLEFVGIEVDECRRLPDGMIKKTIPDGRYAVFTHKGKVADLLKTYDYIWGSWILSSRETLDEREDFEVYDERFLGADDPQSQIDIYIPVK